MGGSSSQTVGYQYYLGLHMVICHGPVDSVNKVYVDKRLAYENTIVASSSHQLFEPDLFGGDKKEGGVAGTVDYMFGENTQLPNEYLVQQNGNRTPAYRGVLSLVFRRGTFTVPGFGGKQLPVYTSSGGGGYIAANSPYPKPWAVEVTDIPGAALNPGKENINSGSANGAHIIYEALTDTEWGAGQLDSDLDIPSFIAASNTLFDEGFGMSLGYMEKSTIESFITEILKVINAVLYPDRSTGKYKLVLIRDDYDEPSLPLFDETNITSFEYFERPAFAELVNEYTITYRRRGDLEDSAITVQDLASIQAQGGVVSQTSDFTGVDTAEMAGRIGVRELNQVSTPLCRVRLVVNRDGWNINPGDVIAVSWAALGIERVVIRVTQVNYGTFEDSLVGIDGLEDIFGLPSNSYIKPVESGWVDTVTKPLPALSTSLVERPYYDLATKLSAADFTQITDDDTFAQLVTEKPAQPAFNVQMFSRIGTSETFVFAVNGQFAPVARLAADLDVFTELSIPINAFSGSIAEVVIGGYAYLNDEVLRIDSIDLSTNLISVGRGALDSYPMVHSVNDIIYFADGNDAAPITVYTASNLVQAKALTQTSLGVLPLDDAPIATKTFVGRQGKPYLPSQIMINGAYFPSSIGTNTFAISWEHQDRTQQVAGIEDWFNVALGAQEAGTTYTVGIYNADTSALLVTQSGIVGKTFNHLFTYPSGTLFNMRIEVESNRNGTISFSTFKHTFMFEIPITQRVTEDGSTRLAENDDRRITED